MWLSACRVTGFWGECYGPKEGSENDPQNGESGAARESKLQSLGLWKVK